MINKVACKKVKFEFHGCLTQNYLEKHHFIYIKFPSQQYNP